jgi:hypothetical protein
MCTLRALVLLCAATATSLCECSQDMNGVASARIAQSEVAAKRDTRLEELQLRGVSRRHDCSVGSGYVEEVRPYRMKLKMKHLVA